jgi:hypothetical protein
LRHELTDDSSSLLSHDGLDPFCGGGSIDTGGRHSEVEVLEHLLSRLANDIDEPLPAQAERGSTGMDLSQTDAVRVELSADCHRETAIDARIRACAHEIVKRSKTASISPAKRKVLPMTIGIADDEIEREPTDEGRGIQERLDGMIANEFEARAERRPPLPLVLRRRRKAERLAEILLL